MIQKIGIAFRVDGGIQSGLGHVMRCIALAQGLRKFGFDKLLFITKDHNENVIEIIKRAGFELKSISQNCDLDTDLRMTSSIIGKYGFDIVFTDSYNIDENYLLSLRDKCKLLVTIDDLNMFVFPSDMVINPNFGAEKLKYNSTRGKSKFLLGVDYFPFREEFLAVKNKSHHIDDIGRNILITMGGSDLVGSTRKVVRAIEMIGEIELNITIIASGINDREAETHRFAKKGCVNYEIVVNPPNIAKLMMWADLAIVGGGLTKYELAITGTPGIVIPQVEHQVKLCKEFEKLGTITNLGNCMKVSERQIMQTVKNLLKNKKLRQKMSANGKKLGDGKGVERVVKMILNAI